MAHLDKNRRESEDNENVLTMQNMWKDRKNRGQLQFDRTKFNPSSLTPTPEQSGNVRAPRCQFESVEESMKAGGFADGTVHM